jgi:hypothetical protein
MSATRHPNTDQLREGTRMVGDGGAFNASSCTRLLRAGAFWALMGDITAVVLDVGEGESADEEGVDGAVLGETRERVFL